ncbi:calcium-binding protein [Streptomyces sp. VRA16 Mangrove soil]|uniref:calcium-binding protein n=1 Tax=Streptomyces sp. VRA16 Mangrove soil TaxID=2817434 RepID=UPI001A9E6CA2|nr:calcium-binding protein [Streptomyces sp. VRA16 Mangrove soil]MBO1337603.1 calcium-binding protein [Streptomyces sp. VRA16 Mangrove soil]
MRIRATAAAVTVSGALALTAFAVPAQADSDSARSAFAQAKAGLTAGHATTFAARSAAADDQVGDTTISKIVINGGKDVVLGTTKATTVKVTFQATDDSGINPKSAFGALYHGTDVASSDAITISNEDGETVTSCTAVNATTSNCTLTFPIDPQWDLTNRAAGQWKAALMVQANDSDFTAPENAKTFSVKRYAKLSTNASPEPVKKGRTITVTGSLTRANWDTHKYAGYTSQKVTLQFRKKTSSTYTDLKTVTSSSTGSLKTTVTASADGYFRYKFAGTSTTPAVTSTSDFVDVQ